MAAPREPARRDRGTTAPSAAPEGTSTPSGQGVDAMAAAIIQNLKCRQGRSPAYATLNDWYVAVAYTARDRVLNTFVANAEGMVERSGPGKVVAYLSAEFLTGPHLGNSLLNLGITEVAQQALARLGQDLSSIVEQEEEPGLGNGGLGRLAACYMDSLATLDVPAIGYGIRYEFGIFDQTIRDGWQVEVTDKWLRFGNPWEIVRAEIAFDVKLGGRTEAYRDEAGSLSRALASGSPGQGHRLRHAGPRLPRRGRPTCCGCGKRKRPSRSTSRLSTSATTTVRSIRKIRSETISKVLYPNDEPDAGKELRLKQQYFFVSCSLQDMIRLQQLAGRSLEALAGALGGAAERHPPVDRHRRADAAPGRRAWHGLGGGLDHHAADLRLHEPHAAAEALEKWPVAAARHACCRATSRSSTRSTAASSTRCEQRFPGDEALRRGCR